VNGATVPLWLLKDLPPVAAAVVAVEHSPWHENQQQEHNTQVLR